MKPYFYSETFRATLKKAAAVVAVVFVSFGSFAGTNNGGELIFRNPVLASGTAGADGAIYRFSNVATGLDALVKINGRSSSLVTLVNIDLSNTGFDKAFQPQVTYNNGNTPDGNTDYWMEFGISFVQKVP